MTTCGCCGAPFPPRSAASSEPWRRMKQLNWSSLRSYPHPSTSRFAFRQGWTRIKAKTAELIPILLWWLFTVLGRADCKYGLVIAIQTSSISRYILPWVFFTDSGHGKKKFMITSIYSCTTSSDFFCWVVGHIECFKVVGLCIQWVVGGLCTTVCCCIVHLQCVGCHWWLKGRNRLVWNRPIMLNYPFKDATHQQHTAKGVADIFLLLAVFIESDALPLGHKAEKRLHHKSDSLAEVTRW